MIFAACITSVILFTRCNSDNANNSMSDSTDRKKDAMTADNSDKKDTAPNSTMAQSSITDQKTIDFVQKALNGGMMEVELGNYAAQNANDKRVKDFGQMMVTDHSAAGNELKALATSNNIAVPADVKPEDRKHIDMMKKDKGAAFDKAYIDMMLKDHKKDIDEFKKAASDLNDNAYKAFAAKTLPVLQKHLDSVTAISKTVKMK
jgi:putative membrane protein